MRLNKSTTNSRSANVIAACVCSQDSKVHIYTLSGGSLQETQLLSQTGSITSVAYSPDGAYLAAADANRKVELYSCPDYKVSEWHY